MYVCPCQIFQGHLAHTTVCSRCSTKSDEPLPFWNLPLALLKSGSRDYGVVGIKQPVNLKVIFQLLYSSNHAILKIRNCWKNISVNIYLSVLRRVVWDWSLYFQVDGIREFFKVSEFHGENQIYCEDCCAKCDATTVSTCSGSLKLMMEKVN